METFFSFAIIAAALFVLIQSGKQIVRSLSTTARFLNISEYVLSFLLLAFATSLPELSIGINSALLGIPQFSFGDILGTNIVNFTLILGAVAVVGGAVQLRDQEHFKSNHLFELFVVLAPLLLILDGTLSRIDGVILLFLFAWNIVRLLDIDDKILGRKVLRPHLSPHTRGRISSWRAFFKQLLIFTVSITCLLISTTAIVIAAQDISAAIGMPHVLIGILVVSVATSLPDLIIGLQSVRQKMGGIALGDIFGAAAINSSMTLGIVALISPIVLEERALVLIGILFTITAFVLAFIFLRSNNSISRTEGMVLVGLYVVFVIVQLATHFL